MAKPTGADKKLLQSIWESISELVSPPLPEGIPSTSCFLMQTGFSVRGSEYDPSKSGSGLKLAKLFDVVPKVNIAFEATGSHISSEWNAFLATSSAPIKAPPKSEKRLFEEGKTKLYTDYDHLVKTPFYKSLDTARAALTKEQLNVFLLKMKVKKDLAMVGSPTQEDFDRLYKALSVDAYDGLSKARQEYLLRSREVGRYQSYIFAYNTGSLNTLLQTQTTVMKSYEAIDSDTSESYYKVTATPDNWWKYFTEDAFELGDEGWTQVMVSQSYSSHEESSTFSEVGGGGGMNLFFFSSQQSSSHTSRTSHSVDDNENVNVSFEVKVIKIDRPWWETSLLQYKDTMMSDTVKGQWSNGDLSAANRGSFPLIPVAMVLAKNITVTATKFSSKMQEAFSSYSHSGAGGFNLLLFSGGSGGGGAGSKHDSTAVWSQDTQTLTVTGTQVIGWVCDLIPSFPPTSA